MAEDTPFRMFDFSQQTNHQPNSEKPFVLDPTELYDISSGYIPITTEVEWIEYFGVNDSPCWVKGKRLCDWAEAWLRAWNKLDAIAEIKQHPRLRLETLFAPIPLPSEWTGKQLLALVNKLDSYPQDNPIARLLADLTGSNEQIWLAEPSIQNLAAWLAIPVPEECKPLERVWQHQFQNHRLASYYQTEDKLLLLRRWLGIADPAVTELGMYPLPVPDLLGQEFDSHWEQQLYRSEGRVLDSLTPTKVAGIERIANCAYRVLSNRPNLITKARVARVAAYLSYQQRQELRDRQPPPQPQPLALNANPKQALDWVTKSYLPFRRWEIVIHQPACEQRISDAIADSFVEWILEHYPQMKVDPVERSDLNYSVASLVQNLCQSSPVLWVVVDGLGWLDHLELLSFLTQNSQLAVETYIEPRFSVLPTKTEYAKWSLYAQLLPSDPSWVDDAGKAFPKLGLGERYTDYRKAELLQDLRQDKHKLYCWDTDRYDKLNHTERDWQHLYQFQRPHTLEGIAKEIQSFVNEYPRPDLLKIVVASDHGQILGISEQITSPVELQAKGRMAIGKTNDPRFVVLERDRYGLSHDISIVKSSASTGAFNHTTDKKIIGSHGGLFPEEVAIGVSVLRKSIQRRPVLITCRGEGKPREPGELEIIIDNPNSVPIAELCLYIKELSDFNTGKPLEQIIPANESLTFKVTIPEVPELPLIHEGDRLLLSGELTFLFAGAEAGSAKLASDSAIVVHQIFSSGGINLDDF